MPRFFSNPVLVPIPVLLSDGHPISDGGISHPMKRQQGLLVQNAAKSLVLIAQWEYPAVGTADVGDHQLTT